MSPPSLLPSRRSSAAFRGVRGVSGEERVSGEHLDPLALRPWGRAGTVCQRLGLVPWPSAVWAVSAAIALGERSVLLG